MKELDDYIAARKVRDSAVEIKKAAETKLAEAERDLVDAMVNQKTKSIKDDADRTFFLAPKFRFSIAWANQAEVRQWLAQRGLDESQYVREEIVRARVKEAFAAAFREGGEESVPKCINLDTTPGITARGWKDSDDDE